MGSVPADGEAGLVVETVLQGSTGHQAGIRSGDVLLTWSRPPTPASALRSPFDLYDVSIEELPRGAVTLVGLASRRHGQASFLTVWVKAGSILRPAWLHDGASRSRHSADRFADEGP